jgi:hypothetical protein
MNVFRIPGLTLSLFLISAFQLSAFQLLPNCGFVQPSFRFQLFSFCRNAALVGSARPFDVGSWKLEVGCSMFDVDDKPSEYNSPPSTPWGWSGGCLVPLWYLPIPISYLKHPFVNQSRLSKPLSRGFSALKPFSGLDAWRWMSNMRCPRPEKLTLPAGHNPARFPRLC